MSGSPGRARRWRRCAAARGREVRQLGEGHLVLQMNGRLGPALRLLADADPRAGCPGAVAGGDLSGVLRETAHDRRPLRPGPQARPAGGLGCPAGSCGSAGAARGAYRAHRGGRHVRAGGLAAPHLYRRRSTPAPSRRWPRTRPSGPVRPPVALQDPGGFTVWRTGTPLAVLVAVWAMLTVIRITRGDEEAGRWDILAGRPVPA